MRRKEVLQRLTHTNFKVEKGGKTWASTFQNKIKILSGVS